MVQEIDLKTVEIYSYDQKAVAGHDVMLFI